MTRLNGTWRFQIIINDHYWSCTCISIHKSDQCRLVNGERMHLVKKTILWFPYIHLVQKKNSFADTPVWKLWRWLQIDKYFTVVRCESYITIVLKPGISSNIYEWKIHANKTCWWQRTVLHFKHTLKIAMCELCTCFFTPVMTKRITIRLFISMCKGLGRYWMLIKSQLLKMPSWLIMSLHI